MSLVFHKSFLLGVCVTSFLSNVNPPHIWRCQQIGKNIFFQTILSCLEPYYPRGMVTNSRTIWFKGPYDSVQQHWNTRTWRAFSSFHSQFLESVGKTVPKIKIFWSFDPTFLKIKAFNPPVLLHPCLCNIKFPHSLLYEINIMIFLYRSILYILQMYLFYVKTYRARGAWDHKFWYTPCQAFKILFDMFMMQRCI